MLWSSDPNKALLTGLFWLPIAIAVIIYMILAIFFPKLR
jgi:phage shock protein PspC (stress-responsive transcriptional regulator)